MLPCDEDEKGTESATEKPDYDRVAPGISCSTPLEGQYELDCGWGEEEEPDEIQCEETLNDRLSFYTTLGWNRNE
jgi:hypothetical protein